MDDNLLDDIIQDAPNIEYKLADKGLRFANYMIDYISITLGFGFILGAIMVAFGDTSYLDETDNILATQLRDYVIGAVMMTTYYTLSEYFFKGKTLGKLLTKTRAVTLENRPMDLGTAFKRSLSRIVPFEAFSFLGSMPSGWHDRWTDTKVILDKDWREEF